MSGTSSSAGSATSSGTFSSTSASTSDSCDEDENKSNAIVRADRIFYNHPEYPTGLKQYISKLRTFGADEAHLQDHIAKWDEANPGEI